MNVLRWLGMAAAIGLILIGLTGCRHRLGVNPGKVYRLPMDHEQTADEACGPYPGKAYLICVKKPK